MHVLRYGRRILQSTKFATDPRQNSQPGRPKGRRNITAPSSRFPPTSSPGSLIRHPPARPGDLSPHDAGSGGPDDPPDKPYKSHTRRIPRRRRLSLARSRGQDPCPGKASKAASQRKTEGREDAEQKAFGASRGRSIWHRAQRHISFSASSGGLRVLRWPPRPPVASASSVIALTCLRRFERRDDVCMGKGQTGEGNDGEGQMPQPTRLTLDVA
jgi:hypothetical protein